MPLFSFADLQRFADAEKSSLGVAVAGGADVTVLAALQQAQARGWITPFVAGREREIKEVADRHGIDWHPFHFLDADEPAGAAVAAVRDGRAALLMKGQISTPALMKAILDPGHGLRTGQVICQVVLMSISSSGRRFLMADTGITIRPTVDQKAEILMSAVAVAHALGKNHPRVAVMAASESVSEALPETLEAAELTRRHQNGALPDCIVQGPLSFDLAYAADAADKKGVAGPVSGAADVMLFPDLTAANLTVKAIMYTAECVFGGVLMGAACPVVFMSRADTTATRLNSLALALRLASG